MKFYKIIFSLFLCFPIHGSAQPMEVIQNEINIPDLYLNEIISNGLQDSVGYIWLSAASGYLYRYDNQVLKKYGPKDGIGSGGVREHLKLPGNKLLIAVNLTDKNERINIVFDPVKEKGVPLESYTGAPIPFDENQVRKVLQNEDGTIWFYLFNRDIYELKDRKFQFWGNLCLDTYKARPYKSTNGFVYAVSIENNISTINKIGPNNQIQHKVELPEDYIFDDFLRPNPILEGDIYFVMRSDKYKASALFYFDGKKNHFADSIKGYDPVYWSLKNFILRVSDTEGVVFDKALNQIAKYDHSNDKGILFSDEETGWWIKKDRQFIKRLFLEEKKFHHYDEWDIDSPWHKAARGIVANKRGELFISKGGTLSRINPDGSTNFFYLPKQTGGSGDFYGLEIGEGNDLWVAYGAGVVKFNMETSQFESGYNVSAKISSVLAPYHDKLGQFWLGGSYGICKWNDLTNDFEKFEGYPGYPLPEKLRVFAFYENTYGMWLSTGEGIFLFDIENESIERFYTRGTGRYYIPHDVISYMEEDDQGNFWLSSKGGGLIYWNPNTGEYSQYTTENGLKNNVLYACYQDDYNQIWLPSNNGLMRFDKLTKEVIHYTENDGIPDREFNTSSHYRDSIGQLYFGGLNGVIRFHPSDFLPLTNPYPIVISGIEKTNFNDSSYHINLENVLDQNQVEILPEDKYVKINFALLNFENNSEWDYAYKIEGHHSDWITLDEPSVILQSLPYGDYDIHFKCKVSGYNWKELEIPLHLSVVIPYYKSWWFIFLMIILGIALIGLLVRWRLSASLKKQEELQKLVEERTTEISKQAEELKSLDKMKTQFFANISHELRTPLTLILGPVKEMQSNQKNELSPFQIQSHLAVINRNADKLLGLVEEILDLSKLDAGKLSLQEEPTLLIDFVRFVKSNFESIAELNQIGYHLNFTISAKEFFSIDSSKVSTVLNNLLSNAFKFCGENGVVTISVEAKEDTLLFKVTDEGIGIKEADLPFVFDRFYQVNSAGNIVHGGTGIGLSLSKQLVELMGGIIGVESDFGKGSTFYFEIPKKESKSTVRSPIEEKQTNASFHKQTEDKLVDSNPFILLVEDNVDMAQFIQSILSAKFRIVHAKNGAEGLRYIENHSAKIDLILSDVMMPVMDGFTLLEKIKQNEQWLNIPIIMLTARAAESDKLHGLTTGADDYMTKPFSSQELLTRIHNLLTNYNQRKLWQNDLTDAVKSISVNRGNGSNGDEQAIQKERLTKETQDVGIISKKDLAWLKDVEKLINSELENETFVVQDLAEKMFISKRQFERKIKAITGLTPAKLVLEIRLNTGRKLLEDGHYSSVSEVSYAIGIQTPSYFSKLYEKRYGRKPSDYFV